MAAVAPDLREYKLEGRNVEKAREYLLSRHERERGEVRSNSQSNGTVTIDVPPLSQWPNFSIENNTLAKKLRSYTQQIGATPPFLASDKLSPPLVAPYLEAPRKR